MKKKITKKDFEAWAHKLGPRKRFDFQDVTKCVVATFLTDIGFKNVVCGMVDFQYEDYMGDIIIVQSFPKWLRKISNNLRFDSSDGSKLSRADVFKACR